MDKHKLADMRNEYLQDSFDVANVDVNPMLQFQYWFEQVATTATIEPNAMVLATATPDGKTTTRVVLLKHYDEQGFIFFTNYLSQKGSNIAVNPFVSLTFFWPLLERQVHVQGQAIKIAEQNSDIYFQQRPKQSQIAAWASQQSVTVLNKQQLTDDYRQYKEKYCNQDVPRPPHWGGYNVEPTAIEFWQGGAARLHDRICYQKTNATANEWKITRKSP